VRYRPKKVAGGGRGTLRLSLSGVWIAAVLGLLLYVASFLVLRYEVVANHEITRFPERHWLRPVYEPLYYPLRWLDANEWSLFPPKPRKLVGTVLEVAQNRLALDRGDGWTIAAGFVCEPSVCALLDGVTKGVRIEATFGVTLVAGRDTFVNKLLSLRLESTKEP